MAKALEQMFRRGRAACAGTIYAVAAVWLSGWNVCYTGDLARSATGAIAAIQTTGVLLGFDHCRMPRASAGAPRRIVSRVLVRTFIHLVSTVRPLEFWRLMLEFPSAVVPINPAESD